MKKLLFFGWVMIFVLMTSVAWSASATFARVQANVSVPTIAEIRIEPWGQGTISNPTNRVIDFNTGATGTALPGRTSYADDDAWTSASQNVGFDAVCIGPSGSKLRIRSNELHDDASHVIPHKVTYTPTGGSPVTNVFFGCTVTADTSITVIFDDAHSVTDQIIDTLSSGQYGHTYHIYNKLTIPANATPANYYSGVYVVSFY